MTVSAVATEADPATTLSVSGVELWFGSPATPCGAATTTNTDQIQITRASTPLRVDESGGRFAPGATPELESTTNVS